MSSDNSPDVLFGTEKKNILLILRTLHNHQNDLGLNAKWNSFADGIGGNSEKDLVKRKSPKINYQTNPFHRIHENWKYQIPSG